MASRDDASSDDQNSEEITAIIFSTQSRRNWSSAELRSVMEYHKTSDAKASLVFEAAKILIPKFGGFFNTQNLPVDACNNFKVALEDLAKARLYAATFAERCDREKSQTELLDMYRKIAEFKEIVDQVGKISVRLQRQMGNLFILNSCANVGIDYRSLPDMCSRDYPMENVGKRLRKRQKRATEIKRRAELKRRLTESISLLETIIRLM